LALAEGFSEGVGIRRTAPVQTARPGQSQCRVWPARYRLQPDPPGQPALGAAFSAGVARDGGGLNSLLPRGVPKREQPMPCRQANDAEIGLFADLIGIDSAL
jgi:hypothetical protein